MTMKYETPSIRVIDSESEDVITSSNGLIIGDDDNHGDAF